MRITLDIDDAVMRALKREAVRQGRALGELVEVALRTLLLSKPSTSELPPLPEFHTGGARLNIANRDMLYSIMEK